MTRNAETIVTRARGGASSLSDRLKHELNQSGIAPEMQELNFYASQQIAHFESLTKLTTKSIPGGWYWYVQFVDPIYGDLLDQGELKPAQPLQWVDDKKKKHTAKYLSYPKGHKPIAGCLRVSIDAWKRIASKNQMEFDFDWIDDSRADLGFWEWVMDNRQIPISITEGAKKAAFLLSVGYVCISISGVWNGLQSDGRSKQLIDSLPPFLRGGRTIQIAYDADVLVKKAVHEALYRFGREILAEFPLTDLKILSWPIEKGKGIDDYGATQGIAALESLYESSLSWSEFKKNSNIGKSWEELVFEDFIRHGNYYLRSPVGDWYVWNADRYVPTTESAILTLLAGDRLSSGFLSEYDEPGSDPEKGQLNGSANTTANIKRFFSYLEARCTVPEKHFNPEGYFQFQNVCLHFNVVKSDNGRHRLNVEEITLHPLEPPFITHQSPVRYDPKADATDAMQIINSVRPQDSEILMKNLALALNFSGIITKHSRAKTMHALFLLGTGSNGKDVYQKAISPIYRGYFESYSLTEWHAHSTGKNPFALSNLPGCRLNWASENSVFRLDNQNTLKSAVTGECIYTQEKYKPAQKCIPRAVLVFNSNERPVVETAHPSVRERLGFIYFDKTFTANPSGPHELQARPEFSDSEWLIENVCPAMLNCLIHAYQHVLDNGIDYRAIARNYDEINGQSNHLSEFMRDIKLQECPGSRVYLTDVYEQLKIWYCATDMGYVNPNDFKRIEFYERSKFDPPVQSSKSLKQRLARIIPPSAFQLEVKGTARKAYLANYKIESPLSPDSVLE